VTAPRAPRDWTALERAFGESAAAKVVESLQRAAVAMVLRDGALGLELLFIRRSEHPNDPWSGQMAFPGGRSEAGDVDLRATAVRETREELALDLDAVGRLLGPLDEVRAMARLRPMNLAIAPFVFRLEREPELTLSEEVESVHWIPVAALLDPKARSAHLYEHQGTMIEYPCLRVGELMIWGLTYRMFVDLAERLV
jgi:8-oxo-dGTP pyrophosphatase MutT (NUDIX family)